MEPRINDLLAEARESLRPRRSRPRRRKKLPTDRYVEGVADLISERTGIPLRHAQGLVRDVSADLINEGYMQPLPREDADVQRHVEWVEDAYALGLCGAVLQEARVA